MYRDDLPLDQPDPELNALPTIMALQRAWVTCGGIRETSVRQCVGRFPRLLCSHSRGQGREHNDRLLFDQAR